MFIDNDLVIFGIKIRVKIKSTKTKSTYLSLRTITKLNSPLILSTIEILNLLKRCHVVINIM